METWWVMSLLLSGKRLHAYLFKKKKNTHTFLPGAEFWDVMQDTLKTSWFYGLASGSQTWLCIRGLVTTDCCTPLSFESLGLWNGAWDYISYSFLGDADVGDLGPHFETLGP